MICAGEIPWGGQHCAADMEHFANLFEYSIIGITKQRGGSFTYDFSAMQRYIDLCADAEQEREDSPISRRWDDYNSLKEEILKRL